jgi:hypothetical protein
LKLLTPLLWIVLSCLASSVQAFSLIEVEAPANYAPLAENEQFLTWGESNTLGQGASLTYSIATSNSSCFMGFESCSALDSFMPSGFQEAIVTAFDRWSSVANLSFTQVEDQAGDIVLAGEYILNFTSVELAHALTAREFTENDTETLSYIAWSEVHFNQAINWSMGDSSGWGYDFLSVATHEVGHALGLRHSDVEGALMSAEYIGVNTLQADDIAGIQTLYGPVSAVPEPSTYLLFLLGLAILLARRTKNKSYVCGQSHGKAAPYKHSKCSF